MKFLIIVQDLRVTGTSQGIIERSFLNKLRKIYPDSIIEVLYVSDHIHNDKFEVLSVNKIIIKKVSQKIPFHIKWYNRIYRRVLGKSYADEYILEKYANFINAFLNGYNLESFDLLMIRSCGLKHENIRALKYVKQIKRFVINFHDPFPYSWYVQKPQKLDKSELYRLKDMISIVDNAKQSCSSAYYMSQDLKFLYAYNRPFYTVLHQFDASAFDFANAKNFRKKQRKIQLSYHGALMFGRNLKILIKAFIELNKTLDWFQNDVELVLRLKGEGVNDIKKMVEDTSNIVVLDCLDFANSSMEQINESDVLILLENGPDYCNILPGKAPFLFSTKKKVLMSSPKRSELRRISRNSYKYMYDMNDFEDAKDKLLNIITDDKIDISIFEDYFSEENFKKQLEEVIKQE